MGGGSDTSLAYNHIDKPGVPETWQWGTGIGAQRHYWAYESHKAILRYAIKKRFDSFILMEDDCCFTSRFDYLYPKVMDDLSIRQWDLVYLGWHCFEFDGDYAIGRNLEIEKRWREEGYYELLPVRFNVGGFHAVVINSRIYNQLANLPALCPMDSQVNRMAHLNRWMITPKVFHVRNTYSFCEDKIVTREVL